MKARLIARMRPKKAVYQMKFCPLGSDFSNMGPEITPIARHVAAKEPAMKDTNLATWVCMGVGNCRR